MKIVRAEAIPLTIPFKAGGARAGWDGQAWNGLDVVLIRLETADGLIGWGEAFSYNCRRAVTAAFEDMVAPVIQGREVTDIAGLMAKLQQTLHLFGRYGITLFALSGLDIALWDLAAKAAGQPLGEFLGGGGADAQEIPGYASLFRYGEPEVVAERTHAALAEGYRHIKLHEIREPEVAAAREAAGPEVPIMVDTNCPWSPAEAREMALRLKPYDLYWLEEPIFPPEDFHALATLRAETGVPLAAGENACTAFQFQEMFAAGAVDYAQPSVTKVGGVTEFRKVAALARSHGVALMPHAPYFGPGFLATLQLMTALPDSGLAEWFYLDREAASTATRSRPRPESSKSPKAQASAPSPTRKSSRTIEPINYL